MVSYSCCTKAREKQRRALCCVARAFHFAARAIKEGLRDARREHSTPTGRGLGAFYPRLAEAQASLRVRLKCYGDFVVIVCIRNTWGEIARRAARRDSARSRNIQCTQSRAPARQRAIMQCEQEAAQRRAEALELQTWFRAPVSLISTSGQKNIAKVAAALGSWVAETKATSLPCYSGAERRDGPVHFEGANSGGGKEGGGGPDMIPLQFMGVPMARLEQNGLDYFEFHHTPNDTFDKIVPEEMAQNVAAWVIWTYLVADTDIDFRSQDSPATNQE